ncbi:BLUF domain-containing protein [Hyphobacterium sp. SN044]|uniref:BLUF domain-containing protein n=1 Tax=Hyphobacterium sp. SN044 TaxID=2912575 RepID=UPI001F351B9F|nr:BLUF domain-containing protein [Hyphobacterium sp. SN044]MCF8880101.1 BLUF domain-containing protein [Hyphobacterium sp. SN044]
MLYRLIYTSKPMIELRPGALSGDFGRVIRDGMRNNLRDGITGALVHTRCRFIQLMEGERNTIFRTFCRILENPIHEEVALIEFAPAANRSFTRWTVAGWTEGRCRADCGPQAPWTDLPPQACANLVDRVLANGIVLAEGWPKAVSA